MHNARPDPDPTHDGGANACTLPENAKRVDIGPDTFTEWRLFGDLPMQGRRPAWQKPSFL